jgi:uncharacterized protein with GYD domain
LRLCPRNAESSRARPVLQRFPVVFIEEYRLRREAGERAGAELRIAGPQIGATLIGSAERAGPARVSTNHNAARYWEGNAMPTFVTLYKYTEQGIRNIKDAPKRVEALKKAAAQAGITVKETLWLQGEYDFLAIAEAPDDATVTAFGLTVLRQGNVHTQTMRAFTVAEMTKILERVT